MPTAERITQLRQAAEAHEPPGLLWTRRRGSVRERLYSGLAEIGATFEDAVRALIDEADPRTTNLLLQEWEAWLGLPDECSPDPATLSLDERRNQVAARLRAVGGCTPAFYISLAADLGYVITITEYEQFRVGTNGASDPVLGEDWPHTWQVNAAQTTVQYFHVGANGAGDPLSSSGNDLLECFLERLRPAHTILRFAYT